MIKTALGVITGCSTGVLAYECLKNRSPTRYAVTEEKKPSENVSFSAN